MVRKVTPSQFKNMIRQAQNKQRQFINKYNQDVRRHNQKVKQASDKYNRDVRSYNARVRANRQRIITELNRLNSQTTIRYQVLRTSTRTLNSSYQNLDAHEQEFENITYGGNFLDLSEKETANSLAVNNALENDTLSNDGVNDETLSRTKITNELLQISTDLDSRWKGALFSINPKNPDASRHFCTSAREIFVQILDAYAPDIDVMQRFPECEKTDEGQPTRRTKIKYILVSAGIVSEAAIDFVDEDVKNVLQLFRVFNDGTHGSSGRYELSKLVAIKERVESGITYLTTICNYA